MYQFNLYAIPPFLTVLFLVSLAFLVINKNKKAMPNIAFGLLALSAAVWHFSFGMVYLSKTQEIALFWNKFVYAGVVFITPFMYHFSVSFLHLKKQRKFVYLFYLLAIIFLFLSRTNYFISSPRKYFWGYYTNVNILHHPFMINWSLPAIFTLVNFFKGYRQIKLPLERQRRKYMFMFLFICLIAAIDYLPAYGISIYPFGYLPVIIGLSVFTAAMVRYKLMDIAVTITRTGIFVAIYTFVLGLPFLLIISGKSLLIDALGQNWWLGPMVLLTILATIGPFLYIYLQRRAESILLRKQRAYQDTLKQAARELARIHKLKRLLDLIVHIVTKTAGIQHSAIYLFEPDSQNYLLKARRNLKDKLARAINKDDPLILWFHKHKEPLVYEEISRMAEDRFNPVFRELEEEMKLLQATVIVPGFLKDKLLGFLLLGEKRLGGFYTTQDLDTFTVLANQAALAIENAVLYENIEEEVKERTEELVQVQKQLIQAEKLATVGTLAGGVAHEINNPLTAILTNVQMLLLENPVDSKLDRESLELIEEATKRCRTIVQKLMAYAKKPLETTQVSKVDLTQVLKNVISFLNYQLKQENISILSEIKENNCFVLGNQGELEQVVTNIFLNAKDAIRALKKSGTIQVSLLTHGDWVEIKIQDDGIGIPKEKLAKIFDPFFTTKDVGKGTGLGLSISQAIIEKHQGHISVESALNKGSIFTIELPKVKEKV